jgi:hypothetical protein
MTRFTAIVGFCHTGEDTIVVETGDEHDRRVLVEPHTRGTTKQLPVPLWDSGHVGNRLLGRIDSVTVEKVPITIPADLDVSYVEGSDGWFHEAVTVTGVLAGAEEADVLRSRLAAGYIIVGDFAADKVGAAPEWFSAAERMTALSQWTLSSARLAPWATCAWAEPMPVEIDGRPVTARGSWWRRLVSFVARLVRWRR